MAQIQVHNTLHNTARAVTIHHPNSFDAVCFKKIYLNHSNTINGAYFLGSEDIAEVDFEELGMAKVLFVETYQTSNMIADGINSSDSRIKTAALIEPDVESEFELSKGDIFYIVIDERIGLAYEIVGIETPIGLPTALNTKRFLLNQRDDLSYFEQLPKGHHYAHTKKEEKDGHI